MWTNLCAVIRRVLRSRPGVVAALSGLAAALLAAGYLERREGEILRIAEPVLVVIASSDIPAGEELRPTALKETKTPRRFVQPAAVASLEDALGRVAAISIRAGAQITEAVARRPSEAGGVAALIPAGRRAFSIPFEEAEIPRVRPNDLVDILATFDLGEGSSARRTTLTVAEGLPVLAVGMAVADDLPHSARIVRGQSRLFQNASALPPSSRGEGLTLAATPGEAQILAFTLASGKLAVALCPAGEEGESERPAPTTIGAITGGHEELAPSRRGFREYRGR